MKQLKNIDSVARAQYLRIFVTLLVPSLFIGGVLSMVVGYKAIIIGIVLSAILPILMMFFSDRLGGISSILYKGGQGKWSIEEKFESEMAKVRHLKMNYNFDAALETVNSILDQIPDYPEAMLLKAQILWDGFENYAGAKACLKKISDMNALDGKPIKQWASSLSEEISAKKKQKSVEAQS